MEYIVLQTECGLSLYEITDPYWEDAFESAEQLISSSNFRHFVGELSKPQNNTYFDVNGRVHFVII